MRARLRRHLDNMVVAGVVAALVAGAPAVAGPLVDYARQAGNANSVDGLNASRTPRAGHLLALNASKKFPASVVPAGARGRTGPAGPAGATGATGSPGAKGDTGAAGATGGPGSAGAQGAKGDKGDPGAAGANGAPGADGAHGAKGDTGDTGAAGANGAPGAKGDKGDTGAAGADGAPGTPGAPGAKGDKGDTGAAGATGAPGAPGAQGAKGDNGAAGADGAPGTPGAQGAKGDAGAAGANGAPGTDGAQGAKGDKGDPGAKGDKGDPGETGPAGSAAAYPPIVDVNPILRPSGSNLWDRVQLNGNSWFFGYRSSFPNGTDASYLEWDLPLQAGTWTIDVVYVKSDDAGILSLSLGGDALAPEIDAYRPQADGIEFNQVATFTGVTVATSGIHRLRIKTASKNPASSGYLGYLTWIRLVRE
ncbi:MAG TPA: hypothetical protein VNP89_12100 [Gaiellaceae bacterium]|nr:hypothetical protein [Gaiellaceae bacterium]